ncbi:hypothetical protein F511_09289 [Dorcoceras hygrometricum]|uniref:Uncharacterized protein n=1 Tax=Dorcoceras hygrometricum TaxID=472368 RepID=A0A2Z7DCI8_9LAMI|nr:hypothetical protein F511_09289 [Dorcoceras hygrometricum]
MRSTNSFSPNRLKPAMLTSSMLSNHEMLTSSKLLTDLTKIKQISRATLASSPLHKYAMLTSSDLLLNFTKIRKSQTFKKCSTYDSQLESETQTFTIKSEPPEIAKTRLIQQLILNTNSGLTDPMSLRGLFENHHYVTYFQQLRLHFVFGVARSSPGARLSDWVFVEGLHAQNLLVEPSLKGRRGDRYRQRDAMRAAGLASSLKLLLADVARNRYRQRDAMKAAGLASSLKLLLADVACNVRLSEEATRVSQHCWSVDY